MAQWRNDATAQWFNGAKAQRRKGAMAQWFNGAKAQRRKGAMAQWFNGSTARGLWMQDRETDYILSTYYNTFFNTLIFNKE